MSAPQGPATKPAGTAVAKAAPGDALDRIGKQHVEAIRQARALTMALRNEAWGKDLSPRMQSAVAEYMRRFRLDVSEVEVLGGNIYRTGYYYRRRIAEMRTKGLIEQSGGDMIGPDPRLDEMMQSTDPEIATWAKSENFRRMRERIRWSVPDDATHAYVVGVKLRTDASLLEGCDWITPKRMKKGKFGERVADPVGAEEPEKTVITRAWRRCGLLVAAEIPELRADEEVMNANAEIVDAQIEQAGQEEHARELEINTPAQMIAAPKNADDPYGVEHEIVRRVEGVPAADVMDPVTGLGARVPPPSPTASVSAPSNEAEPTRTPSELFKIPFGMGQARVATPLHAVSTSDLKDARQWAMQNGKFPEFVESAGIVLDDRTNAPDLGV